MEKISFLGCGSWGGALGSILAEKNFNVIMWHRNSDIVKSLDQSRRHYLMPNLVFPENVAFTNDISMTIRSSSIVVLALPSQSIRKLISDNLECFAQDKLIVNVSKGIEIDTLMTVSEVIKDVLSDSYRGIVTLSGPSHAEEVIQKHPTTLVSASSNLDSAQKVQNLFATDMLRTYRNNDIKGVELGGAMKNVIAIAAGICDGIGYGDNSKAALITRGMTEITRLGKTMGGQRETFNGLSGFGDLIVTCLSRHSRNRQLGEAIGKGRSLKEITSEMNMVAEGIYTAKSVHQLRLKHDVEMPIHEAIYKVLFEDKEPRASVIELMKRRLSEENN